MTYTTFDYSSNKAAGSELRAAMEREVFPVVNHKTEIKDSKAQRQLLEEWGNRLELVLQKLLSTKETLKLIFLNHKQKTRQSKQKNEDSLTVKKLNLVLNFCKLLEEIYQQRNNPLTLKMLSMQLLTIEM